MTSDMLSLGDEVLMTFNNGVIFFFSEGPTISGDGEFFFFLRGVKEVGNFKLLLYIFSC